VQLEVTEAGNEPAYQATAWLVLGNLPFTAIFAFNDHSAIGAIARLKERGLHIRQDLSLVGFDNIPGAQTNNPSLTTVRQPLRAMVEMAANAILRFLDPQTCGVMPATLAVKPGVVIRNSTSPVANKSRFLAK
jgi:DNA-binding LacI/PurR family transcriptional regulator